MIRDKPLWFVEKQTKTHCHECNQKLNGEDAELGGWGGGGL